MALADIRETVLVFDLDDTLYDESDYVSSGIRALCRILAGLYRKDKSALIAAVQASGERDWLAFLVKELGLPNSSKESLLWLYRTHSPDIALSDTCRTMLDFYKQRAKALVVLTDGRSITQRLKLQALGLSDFPVYVSEDFASEKPEPVRFLRIQEDFPADHYVYIGDNVKKDFIGCNPLGWITIGKRAGSRNIHSQSLDGLAPAALPQFWIDDWSDMYQLLG